MLSFRAAIGTDLRCSVPDLTGRSLEYPPIMTGELGIAAKRMEGKKTALGPDGIPDDSTDLQLMSEHRKFERELDWCHFRCRGRNLGSRRYAS